METQLLSSHQVPLASTETLIKGKNTMYNTLLGLVFLSIGLILLGSALISYTNLDYPLQKALVTGTVQFVLGLFPFMIDMKLLGRRKA